MFQVQNVTASKNGKKLLDNVSFDAREGQVLAVLGENGAGKSVLLRSAGCVEPDAIGNVTLKTRTFVLPIQSGAPGPWPLVTLVFQHLGLWPHLSGRDNIFLPWRYSAQDARLSEYQLSELFEKLDLLYLLDKLPAEMSGGERQRIALARAFALKPLVLLLDEPSSALDARHALEVANVICESKQEGTIIVCATHNLGFASRISDRFIFLENGQLIAEDTWSALAKVNSEAVQSFLDVNAFPAPRNISTTTV